MPTMTYQLKENSNVFLILFYDQIGVQVKVVSWLIMSNYAAIDSDRTFPV